MLYTGAKTTSVIIGGVDYSAYLVTGSISTGYASEGGLCPTTCTLTFQGNDAGVLDAWEQESLERGKPVVIQVGGYLHPRGTLRVIKSNFVEDNKTLTVEAGCYISYYQSKQTADATEQTEERFGTGVTVKAKILELLDLSKITEAADEVIWEAPGFGDFLIRGPVNPSGGWLQTAGQLLDSINCYLYSRADGRLAVRQINTSASDTTFLFDVATNVVKTEQLRGEIPPDRLKVNGNWRKIFANGYTRTFDEGHLSGTETLNPGASPEFEKKTYYWLYGKPVKGPLASTMTEQKRYSPGKDGKLLTEYKQHAVEVGVVSTSGGGPYTEVTEYSYSGDFLIKKVREKIRVLQGFGILTYTQNQIEERDIEEWNRSGAGWVYSRSEGRLRENVATLTVTNPDGSSSTVTNTSYWWDINTYTASGSAAIPPTAERRTPLLQSESKRDEVTILLSPTDTVGERSITIPHLPDSPTFNFSQMGTANALKAAAAPAVVTKYLQAYGDRRAALLKGLYKGLQIVSTFTPGAGFNPLSGVVYTRIGGSKHSLLADATTWQFNRLECLVSYDCLYLGKLPAMPGAGASIVVSSGSFAAIPGGSGLALNTQVVVNGVVYTLAANPANNNAPTLFTTPDRTEVADISGVVTITPAATPSPGFINIGDLEVAYDYIPQLLNIEVLDIGYDYGMTVPATDSDRYAVLNNEFTDTPAPTRPNILRNSAGFALYNSAGLILESAP